ncbi:hypothetical protein JXM67_02145 [candidate division WOR-3 bacterium]|nr:hypothetical protein [candidate division WOR-3 bacterium]
MEKELDFTGAPEPVVKKLSGYLKNLVAKIGDGLESIVVYGSASSGEFDPKRSNINLVIVVDKLNLELLHRVQPLVKRGARKGIVAPLFLTHEHMNTSSDVFPIEFLDMSDFHKVILGKDPFAKLKIGTENLRLECEEKLKGSLINLRQSYLEIADQRGPMMNLVASSIIGVVSIFRGLIRLAGKKAPASKKEVIAKTAELYPVPPNNFSFALEIKLTAPRMTREEMDAFFAAYIRDLEELALYVDRMGKKETKAPAKKSGKARARKASPRKVAKKPAAKKITKKSAKQKKTTPKKTQPAAKKIRPTANKPTTKKSKTKTAAPRKK